MRNTNATILKTIAETLHTAVLPAVQSEAAKASGGLCVGLVGVLLSRETAMPLVMQEHVECLEALQRKMQDVVDQSTGPAEPVVEPALGFLADDGYDEVHARLVRAQASLAVTAARLAEMPDGSLSEADRGTADALLREMGEAELELTRAFFASLQSQAAGGAAAGGPANDRDSIEPYLAARFPERTGLRVTEVSGAGFSMSKSILFVSTTDNAGRDEDLVFRQEKAIRFMEDDCTLVRNEYALIKCAHAVGMPVPEPLWLDTSGALGPDFMVMPKVAGAQLGEPFRAFEPLSEETIMYIAELLAKLHGGGLAPFEQFFRDSGQADVLDMNIKEATLHRIAVWKRYFAAPTEFPNPSKVWLFDWLERNVPENDAPPVLVHGDFNIHNFLAIDGRITALLDWEWGHAGNGLEDLNNVRHHVERYSDWDRFVQHYEAHGGPRMELNKRTLNFNQCLTSAIFSSAASRLGWHVASGDIRDVAAVFGADNYGFEFQRVALEASLNAPTA